MVNSKDHNLRIIALVSLGTILEWAEYVYYGYIAITLAGLFFPDHDPQIRILKTFGIFAIGYVMRPLGAILFGTIGDRLGRKPALLISMLLMGISTFSIGCLPTFQTIGFIAPLLLLLLRMLQGLAVSGEYNGAGIFLIEKLGQRYPSLAGSWISASAATGMVVGAIAAFLVSLPHMPSWAWRLPFLCGGVTCFVGMWFRSQVSESPLFDSSSTKPATPSCALPLIHIWQQYKQAILIIAAISAFTGIFVYICNIYIVVFMKQNLQLPTHHATFFAIIGEAIVAIMIPLMAYVADRTDPYRQYRWGLLLIALCAPCIFLLILSGNYFNIFISMALYGALNGIVCGPMVKIMVDQFPTHLRYTGVSLGFSISAALFSGTAPMVAQYLTTTLNSVLAPSFYVSLVALFVYAILTYCFNGKTVDRLNFLVSQ